MHTWHVQFPQPHFELWRSQFFQRVLTDGLWPRPNMAWVVVKVALSALLAGTAAIFIGSRRKDSGIAISTGIAQSIIAGVTVTLLVHAAVSVITL